MGNAATSKGGDSAENVQDYLEKAKKEFEEQWSKNPKVSRKNTGNVFHKLFSTGYIFEHISLVLLYTKKSFFEKKITSNFHFSILTLYY